ncbi:hypothetical protein N665_0051s0026 [Sinapis alba]|nr:hypothetical protein N665_0051s0026 [Sinapis alba]
MYQLPKCLIKEGTKRQVDKVKNTCRTSILESMKKFIQAEYDEVFGDMLFSQVMAIYEHKLRYSGRVVHTFICKQLLIAKLHEVWFHFARSPLRFSMQEFNVITCLKYEDEPDLKIDKWRDDKGFWSTLLKKKGNIFLKQIMKVHLKSCNTRSHVDRLRLVYLCVIAGMVMEKDEKVWIPYKYIKLVMDFDKMKKYSWGLHSFDALIWLMEVIPDIGSLLGKNLREGVISMRCRTWKGYVKVFYEDIISIESYYYSIESYFGSTGEVFPYISSTGNYDIIVDAWFERAVEMKDERVDLIINMKSRLDQQVRMKWKKKYKSPMCLLQRRERTSFRILEPSQVRKDFGPSRAPAPSLTPGASPASIDAPSAVPTSTDAPGAGPTSNLDPTPASTRTGAPAPSRTGAPTPSRRRSPAPSRGRAPVSSNSRASAPYHTGGPANVAKKRSQTKVNKK